MQTIYPVTLTPQEYVDAGFEDQVIKPESCANCGGANALKALGYYARWVSYLLEVFRIRVRRFRCRRCQVSISCLPDFAQPYRVVHSQTVQAGFNGEGGKEVEHWGWLIVAYWKQFSAHRQRLLSAVGNAFGPCPAGMSARKFWRLLMEKGVDLAKTTRRLVREFGTCLFGAYRCHQKKAFSK
jgi:hypothetical protein